jgi:hypothetical protein
MSLAVGWLLVVAGQDGVGPGAYDVHVTTFDSGKRSAPVTVFGTSPRTMPTSGDTPGPVVRVAPCVGCVFAGIDVGCVAVSWRAVRGYRGRRGGQRVARRLPQASTASLQHWQGVQGRLCAVNSSIGPGAWCVQRGRPEPLQPTVSGAHALWYFAANAKDSLGYSRAGGTCATDVVVAVVVEAAAAVVVLIRLAAGALACSTRLQGPSRWAARRSQTPASTASRRTALARRPRTTSRCQLVDRARGLVRTARTTRTSPTGRRLRACALEPLRVTVLPHRRRRRLQSTSLVSALLQLCCPAVLCRDSFGACA